MRKKETINKNRYSSEETVRVIVQKGRRESTVGKVYETGRFKPGAKE